MVSSDLREFLFEENQSERLDKFLVKCMPDLTRSRLQNLIKEGKVLVNGSAVSKSGYTLQSGDRIQIEILSGQPTELVAEDIPLNVIFENDDLMVVDKPAGMVVHPAAGHDQGTLVNAALAHAPDMEGVGGELRPGIVHRLDKNTSGLIIVAKNDHTLTWLQDQFRLRKVRKIYIALSDGHPPTPTGRIEAAIGRDLSQRKQMAVVPDEKGRSAVSEYKVIEEFANHTLFEVHPVTGRTHQIRLHMAMIHCPIVGDTLYGRKRSSLPLDRHFLHAARLEITLPGEQQPRTFESPLPPELQAVLASLR
jgi:23S rRNA pseudouridine1911/1915/1917 synthase